MAAKISPLAPARFPDMPPVEGVRLATAAAGIRARSW
jgi:glutamate N-acetyltransferase / amino-acid N-acetyltransferase